MTSKGRTNRIASRGHHGGGHSRTGALLDRVASSGGSDMLAATQARKPAMLRCCSALIAASLAATAPVSAQVYLHSPREEAATKNLATAFEAARKAHTDALDRHDANLEAGMKAAIDALVDERLTARDLVLAKFVNGDNLVLKAAIEERLKILTGIKDVPRVAKKTDETQISDVETVRTALLDLQNARELVKFTHNFVGKKETVCDADGVFNLADKEKILPRIRFVCSTVRVTKRYLAKFVPCELSNDQNWKILQISAPTNLCFRKPEGSQVEPPEFANDPYIETILLPKAFDFDDIAQLRNAIVHQDEVVQLVEKVRTSLDDELAEAVSRSGRNPTASLKLAICRLNWMTQAIQDWKASDGDTDNSNGPECGEVADSKALAHVTMLSTEQIKEIPAAQVKIRGLSCDSAASVEIANIVKKYDNSELLTAFIQDHESKCDFSTIKTYASLAGKFSVGRSILAKARSAVEDVRGAGLGTLLTTVSGKTLAQITEAAKAAKTDTTLAVPTKGEVLALAIVNAATPLNTLAQYHAGTLPDTSGILVAIAESKMRQSLADLEANRLKTLLNLAERGGAARAEEAALLMEANVASQSNKMNIAALAYAESVSRGRIPGDVMEGQRDHVDYRLWSARERAASDATFAVLAPAVDQLGVYGAGGVKPETIAQFLNAIGLGAIAWSN